MNIASLEDDPIEAKLIHQIVTDAGHTCTSYHTSDALLQALQQPQHGYDLLILDWQVPGKTGKEVIEWVRSNLGNDLIVMFLTNRVLEENIVAGLMAGADDYMTKPIREAELSARIHALSKRIRRPVNEEVSIADVPTVLEAGAYCFDLPRKSVTLHGNPVELKPKEYEIAALFFQNIGQLITRESLMEAV